MNKVVTATPYDPMTTLKGKMFDYEAILPMSLVRQHSRTDDVPSVTDELLSLYRRTALETAQEYTGLVLTEQKVVIEEIDDAPTNPFRHEKPWFWHTTKSPFAQSVAWVYGQNTQAINLHVTPGSRRVRLPILMGDLGMGCCNPCASAAPSMKLMYVAGFDCEKSIPAAIILGCLKYITHVLENAGDIVTAVSEAGVSVTRVRVDQTSNPALASGAIEIWRTAVPDAI